MAGQRKRTMRRTEENALVGWLTALRSFLGQKCCPTQVARSLISELGKVTAQMESFPGRAKGADQACRGWSENIALDRRSRFYQNAGKDRELCAWTGCKYTA